MDSRMTGRYASLAINVPMPPPHWALLERELLRAQEAACAAFYAKYFDERGYLLCIPRWGGNDGPDDAGENLAQLAHAPCAGRLGQRLGNV